MDIEIWQWHPFCGLGWVYISNSEVAFCIQKVGGDNNSELHQLYAMDLLPLLSTRLRLGYTSALKNNTGLNEYFVHPFKTLFTLHRSNILKGRLWSALAPLQDCT